MNLIAFVAASLALGQIHIGVAPDQPVPYVYVDDPLILEIKSTAVAQPQISIEIAPDFEGPPVRIDLGMLALHQGSTLWRPLMELPAIRGRYHLTAQIETGTGPTDIHDSFCRIDRPRSSASVLPIRVRLAHYNARAGLAIRAVGVDTICMPVAVESGKDVDSAAAAGFKVIAVVNSAGGDSLERFSAQSGNQITGWEIDPGTDAEVFAGIAKRLRRTGNNAPTWLVVREIELLDKVLSLGYGAYLDGVVYECPWPSLGRVVLFAETAEKAGYEDLPIICSIGDGTDGPQAGKKFASCAMGLWGDIDGLDIDVDTVYTKSFGPAYAYSAALSQRMPDMDYVGRLNLGENVESRVYRQNARWQCVLWASQDKKEISVNTGPASDLLLFDGRNNPLVVPVIKDDVLKLEVTTEPQFLSGTGGTILGQAAQAEMHREAEAFLDSEPIRKAIPEELVATVRKFGPEGKYTRLDFFNLLKIFPTIEELWHAGTLRRDVAVPALAHLARLAAPLCILEQERKEPFIEPIQSILADCGQRLSLYLTSSATSRPHQRSDWLLTEVNRVMDKSENMAAAGRGIEAGALANLADWRARALVAAMRAEPLGIPEVTQPSPPPESTTAEKKQPADKKPESEKPAKNVTGKKKSAAPVKTKK